MGVARGLDTIPKEIGRKYGALFASLLPGWSITGEYNFQPGVNNAKAASQLNVLMQNGFHPWINEQIKSLLDGREFQNLSSADKTIRLSTLVNFMHEASAPDALTTNGSRTSGWIGYSSRSDPHLLRNAEGGIQPTTAQMRQGKYELTWEKITSSDAGKDVIERLRPYIDADRKLKYTGTIDNGGAFLRSSDAFDLNQPSAWKQNTSSKYSAQWLDELRTRQGITFSPDGQAVKNGVILQRNETKAVFGSRLSTAADVPGGARNVPLAGFGRLSTKLLKKLGGASLSVIALVALAPAANAAQLGDGYQNDQSDAANKKFIQELFATSVSSLAGLIAGILAGAASAGLLAIPVGLAAAAAGAAAGAVAGEWLGGLFYDNFTSTANDIAEWMVPVLAPLGELINDAGDAIAATAAQIEEVIGMMFNAVTDAFNELGDLVTGADGLFGLNGPIFGEGKPLHDLVEWARDKKFLLGDGTWAYDGFDNVLYGTDFDDVLILDRSTGEAFGGKGDDVLLGLLPRYAASGTPLFRDEPDSPLADEDSTLFLDGGEGNDWVLTLLGDDVPDKKDGAVTAGGLGRDWIFNTSPNGIIWGDIANSYDLGRYREAQVDGETVRIEDNAANSDNIWYWADTTLMDAGHSDFLKYFGLPLVGGDANGGLAGYAIYNGLFGAAIGMGNLNRYFSGDAQGWEDEIYIDHIQPWIMYGFKRGDDGNLDMYITNAFEQIFDGLNAALNLGQQDTPDKIHKGWMKIENVDVVGSRLGVLQREADQLVLSNGKKGGSLNMVFRAVNPLQALLPVIKLIPGAIPSNDNETRNALEVA